MAGHHAMQKCNYRPNCGSINSIFKRHKHNNTLYAWIWMQFDNTYLEIAITFNSDHSPLRLFYTCCIVMASPHDIMRSTKGPVFKVKWLHIRRKIHILEINEVVISHHSENVLQFLFKLSWDIVSGEEILHKSSNYFNDSFVL